MNIANTEKLTELLQNAKLENELNKLRQEQDNKCFLELVGYMLNYFEELHINDIKDKLNSIEDDLK